MSRRTLAYVALAAALLSAGGLLSRRRLAGSAPSAAPIPSSARPTPAAASAPPLRRPSSSVAIFAVRSDRAEGDLAGLVSREAIAARLGPRYCGGQAECAAVRATLLDGRATTLRVATADEWDAGAPQLDGESVRARDAGAGRVVVVRVETPTSPEQLAIRAAVAAAGLVAEATEGVVEDPVRASAEDAAAFAAHAITLPLGAPAFRRDLAGVRFEARGEGTVRVVTAGLARWGAPDVEAARVPAGAEQRMADLLFAVARALADGAKAGPVVLSRDEVARDGGVDDAGFATAAPIAIDLASVPSETADSSDFVARVEPPDGDGPVGYVDLAERFFGPLFAWSPSPGAVERRREQAQAKLSEALARWGAGARPKLLVRLPFAIPGDAGDESLWVDVTRYDDRTVTGRIADEPLGATDVSRGQEVTRARSDVQDLRWDRPERRAPERDAAR